MATSTISSKGQITVPVEVRRRMGVKPGDRLEFAFEGGQTVLRPVRGPKPDLSEWYGIAPAFGSIEAINAWVRDLRDEDE